MSWFRSKTKTTHLAFNKLLDQIRKKQNEPVSQQPTQEEKANALSRTFLIEIREACLSFAEDIETRVVIFSGSGKHFSSGADLSSEPDQKASQLKKRRDSKAGEGAILALLNMDQITIASWNRAAMGGGACIATACDFRIGTPTSFMQYPEIE